VKKALFEVLSRRTKKQEQVLLSQDHQRGNAFSKKGTHGLRKKKLGRYPSRKKGGKLPDEKLCRLKTRGGGGEANFLCALVNEEESL